MPAKPAAAVHVSPHFLVKLRHNDLSEKFIIKLVANPMGSTLRIEAIDQTNERGVVKTAAIEDGGRK